MLPKLCKWNRWDLGPNSLAVVSELLNNVLYCCYATSFLNFINSQYLSMLLLIYHMILNNYGD